MKDRTSSVPELSRAGEHKMSQKVDFDESGCLNVNAGRKIEASSYCEIFKDGTPFLPAGSVAFSRRPPNAELSPQ
jgi:hypothetical protein